jgi:hypothetical protein
MQLINGFEGLSASQRGASVALGNFDGVHRGHQALIAEAARAGGQIGAPTGIITFEPHPRRFFQPDAPPFRLTLAHASNRFWVEEAGEMRAGEASVSAIWSSARISASARAAPATPACCETCRRRWASPFRSSTS